MINAYLDQFLDTGWFSESTLYYKGFIYWCEAQSDFDTGITRFFVYKWAVENDNNIEYHTIVEEDGTWPVETVYEIFDKDLELIKKRFLEAPIFDGKSFWEVEKELAWLDDGGPIYKGKNK